MVALRGLARTLHSNFGFEPRNAMLVDTDLAIGGYRGDSIAQMQKRMIEAGQTIPGVESVGLIGRAPLTGGGFSSLIFNSETADLRPANAVLNAMRFNISPEYLHAARTALVAGRPFSWHDDKDSPRVAIVNQRLAEKVFGSAPKAVGGALLDLPTADLRTCLLDAPAGYSAAAALVGHDPQIRRQDALVPPFGTI